MFSNRLARGLIVGAVGAAAIAAGSSLARRTGARDSSDAGRRTMPKAQFGDVVRLATRVLLPTVAKGAIVRRPLAVQLAESRGLDSRAIEEMQRLRDKYWPGPLLFRNPIRPTKHMAVVLAPEHVHRILDETDEPFAAASYEKRGALSHFQPGFSLISHGKLRDERVRWNDEVLDHKSAGHRLAASFLKVVDEEANGLLQAVDRHGELDWELFDDAWSRMIRRVILGDGAAHDQELTDMLIRLRRRGNWSFFSPVNRPLRERYLSRLREHLDRAEPGSLAQVIASTPITENVEPEQQVPQWFFAADPAGMATFRGLALLAAHPEQARRARAEMRSDDMQERQRLPFLRACILESLRLYPTTPLVLRESTRPTDWELGSMPAHTSILAWAQFFHRDDTHLSYAHQFNPDIWLDDRPEAEIMDLAANDWPMIPFSKGPGICSGRQVVLLLASNMLGRLVQDHEVRLKEPQRLEPTYELPGTLNHFSLRFDMTPLRALHGRDAESASQASGPRPGL